MTKGAEGVGLLFPGQGSQVVGMGRDLAERYPAARDAFHEADQLLGRSLSDLCWNGSEAELTQTENAQPAILVHSIATWRALEPLGLEPVAAAGHSLGEWSAHVAAGTLDFQDALQTVALRGRLMAEAGRAQAGTMCAILGLDDAEVERICRAASLGESGRGVVVPANLNAPGQIVISGCPTAVARAAELARAAGAKRVLPLNVSGAFHSPLVASAAAGLAERVAAISLNTPRFPVIANATAEPVRDPENARRLLVEQLTAPVRWIECVRTMVQLGARRMLELGPGNVLSGLARRIDKTLQARSAGMVDTTEQLLSAGAAGWS